MHNKERYYNTSTGQFITEDPIKDGFDQYLYCGNDTVNFADTSGSYDREPAVKYTQI